MNTLLLRLALWGLLAAGLVAAGVGTARAFYKPRLEAARVELAVAESEVSRVTEENAQLARLRDADAAAIGRLRRENAVIRQEVAATRTALESALQTHREWAETPVPQEVQDALTR